MTRTFRTHLLTFVALGVVAVALALPCPAPAQQQENVLNAGKYASLSTYDPHAGPLDYDYLQRGVPEAPA